MASDILVRSCASDSRIIHNSLLSIASIMPVILPAYSGSSLDTKGKSFSANACF